jgi:hypothetical protein
MYMTETSYTCDSLNSVYRKAEVENQTNTPFAAAFYRLVYKSEEPTPEQATFMDFSVEQKNAM